MGRLLGTTTRDVGAAANDATLASLSAEARARATGSRANDIVRRIRDFFGL